MRRCSKAVRDWLLAVGLWALSFPADAATEAASHVDFFAYVLLAIAAMILFATCGRSLARHFGQPTVVGELLIGVIVGNIGYWFGWPVFVAIMHLNEAGSIAGNVLVDGLSLQSAIESLADSPMASGRLGSLLVGVETVRIYVFVGSLWLFSNLGVVFLMFMAGLESSVEKMRSVGKPAVAVAVAGVLLPLLLGFLATWLLLPGDDVVLPLFFGATLAATSVGISAAVFEELGLLHSRPASIVLGAAVLDDILALIVLATVISIAVTGAIDAFEIARIVLLSSAFLGLIAFAGNWLVKLGIPVFERLDRFHVKLLYAVFFMCVIAVLANVLGLAVIIGAFAAGLLLSDKYFHTGESRSIKELVEPLEILLAPIFFVLIGMQVNLHSLLSADTAALVAVLLLVAVAGKLFSGFLLRGEPSKLAIGISMIPRGEVGLIFAGVGHTAGVLDNNHFAAVVSVVFLTTVMAPVALKRSIGKNYVGWIER